MVKLAIVIGAFYFIYHKTVHNNQLALADFITQLEKTLFTDYKVVFILLIFTIFNWFFEILKWQNLVQTIQKISFLQALKQSLGSLTASLFTPNRVGEYGAKAIYFYKTKRKKVMLLNLIGHFSQMIMTLLFGIVGLIFFKLNYDIHFPIFRARRFVYYLALFIVVAFGGRFFISKKIRGFYWSKIISFIHQIPKLIIFKTLLFSLIRYIIFSHQFYYLLYLFGVEVEYSVVIKLIFAIYLIASIIPSLPMFDWLIKGSIAVFVFSFIGVNELIVVTVTTLMWLFNFGLPAIIGSYFVLNFRFVTK